MKKEMFAAGLALAEALERENAALSAQLTAADIQIRRMSAAVLLIKALGGGWSVTDDQWISATKTPATPAAAGSTAP